MACATILNTWTFPTLIGAFLDLSLAYLLLCCSTLAFFASKFLSLFGLSLPCPCNGLFGDPNVKCLQRFLVDAPTRKISSVHSSVRNSFPFDCIWADEDDRLFNLKLISDKPLTATPLLEMKGEEESCSSHSLALSSNEFGNSPRCRSRSDDGKGKGIWSQKPPSGRCRRRRRPSGDRGRVSTVSSSSSSSHFQLIGGKKREIYEESSGNVDSGGESVPYGVGVSTGIGSFGVNPPGIELDEQHGEDKVPEKDASFVEELVRNAQGGGLDGKEADTIRILEQALEEEHAARTALYLELEKERNAAATAADEAMAMILRLQEEKALIEMEARQYQRLIEEKSAYDEEEMNILKEILVRRERENHFLEKEFEACRQMLLSSESNPQSENDPHDMVDESGKVPCPSFDSADDPVLMLQEISESIRNKEMKNGVNRFSEDGPSAKIQSGPALLRKEFLSLNRLEDVDVLKQRDVQKITNEVNSPHMCGCMDGHNVEFQEKGMVFMDECPSAMPGEGTRLEIDSSFCELSGPQEHSLHKRTFHFADEEHGKEVTTRIFHEAVERGDENHSGTEMIFLKGAGEQDNHGEDASQRCRVYQTSLSEMESSVLDVHVVDDKSKRCSEGSRKETELLLMSTAPKSLNKSGFPLKSSGIRTIDVFRDHSSLGSPEAETNIHRSISDMSVGLLPRDSSLSKVLLPDLRSNSISAVDNERLKLETEVRWLRERLKVVQEGREKLSFTMDHREREKFQMQLLEEIAHQLREIRSLTHPIKATRQASLPPPSSKASKRTDLDYAQQHKK